MRSGKYFREPRSSLAGEFTLFVCAGEELKESDNNFRCHPRFARIALAQPVGVPDCYRAPLQEEPWTIYLLPVPTQLSADMGC